MRPTRENESAVMPTLQVYEIVGANEKLFPIPSKGLMSVTTMKSTIAAVQESSSSSDESSVTSCSHDTRKEEEALSVRQHNEYNKENDQGCATEVTTTAERDTTEELSPKPILKRSFSLQDIPVVARRSSWKQLPVPDLEKIRYSSCPTPAASSSLSDTEEAAPTVRKQRRPTVTFDSVQIREYNQTVGDNPSVSMGPPISLDWSFSVLDPISVNDYEDHRGTRRNLRQMMMSFQHRRKVLMWLYGATEQQVDEATRVANQWKRQRALTQVLLPYQKVEELLQSAQRKAKRFQDRRKSAPQTSLEVAEDSTSTRVISTE